MGTTSQRIFIERADKPRTRGVAQFAERLGLNLANALASDSKSLADFFKSVRITVLKAKAHANDALFTRIQVLQHGGDIFLETEVDGRVCGRGNGFIFNKIAEMSVFFFADGGLEGDGRLSNFPGAADLFKGDVHAAGQLLGGRLAAKFLNELPGAAGELVNDLDHVDGNADGARLVGNGARDGLANPPGGVGGEFIPAAPVELVRAFHQAEISFLDEIEELQAMMRIFLGDRDYQAKVGCGEFPFGLLGVGFAAPNNAERALESDQP